MPRTACLSSVYRRHEAEKFGQFSCAQDGRAGWTGSRSALASTVVVTLTGAGVADGIAIKAAIIAANNTVAKLNFIGPAFLHTVKYAELIALRAHAATELGD
jgi:hypothetical protein